MATAPVASGSMTAEERKVIFASSSVLYLNGMTFICMAHSQPSLQNSSLQAPIQIPHLFLLCWLLQRALSFDLLAH